ncbi:MAG TPA: oxidoreductase-like domain-containing protein [Lysobacter sp.]
MASDPPPSPPQKPLPFDCCESGCDRCVFEIYADDLAHYQSALTAWRTRNPGIDPDQA